MKYLLVIAIALGTSNLALAAKPCEELKTEITSKIEANGVKAYTLDIIASDQVGDQKVVGSCDGGTKKIVYAKKSAETKN
jgi:hypothetical protein